jgi:hypothetical protein
MKRELSMEIVGVFRDESPVPADAASAESKPTFALRLQGPDGQPYQSATLNIGSDIEMAQAFRIGARVRVTVEEI